MTPVYWLIAFVVLIAVEMGTMALTTIWFAGGAAVAFLLSLFGIPVEIQLAVFVIVSFLLLIFTKPFLSKYLFKKHSRTNAPGLIGKTAHVTETIENSLGKGMAVVEGQEWTARAVHDEDRILSGKSVKIVDIQGVKLIVTEVEED